MPSGKYIGIKYKLDEPEGKKTEVELAKLEAEQAQNILDLKKSLQDGTMQVADISDQIVNFTETEEEIKANIKVSLPVDHYITQYQGRY